MKDRTFKIIIIVFATILVINIGALFNLKFRVNYKVKPYDPTTLTTPAVTHTLTKSTAKKLIKDLYNTPHIYTEKNLDKQNRNGQSIPIWRVAIIHNDLDLHDYIIAYAHELTHIKYQVADETYTTYKTIVKLYESGNAELQYHAIKEANDILSGCYEDTDYDCGYYIIEYFKKGEKR